MTEEVIVIKRYKSFILGKCNCGCGTDIEVKTSSHLKRSVKGHGQRGKNHARFKGYKTDGDGYILVYRPDHPFCINNIYVREHRLVYEHYLKILFDEDIYIPQDIEIHHIDENIQNNSLINLDSDSYIISHVITELNDGQVLRL